mgnify:CR=1 FL=1
MKISIVVPLYNEERTIINILSKKILRFKRVIIRKRWTKHLQDPN